MKVETPDLPDDGAKVYYYTLGSSASEKKLIQVDLTSGFTQIQRQSSK